MAWGRKATAEDVWLCPPKARKAEEGRGATTCCPRHARLGALSPHTSSSLSLLEARPEVEKLDLSSPGQKLLPCSQGTQRLAESYSQELDTPSHPSSQSRLLRGKWALMRSRGGAGKALVNREAELTQVGNGGAGGGGPHLPPPASCSLLTPKQRPELLFLLQPQRCCVRVALLPRRGFALTAYTHAHTRTHTLTSPGFRDTLKCGG